MVLLQGILMEQMDSVGIDTQCGMGTEYIRMALLTETAAMSLLHMMSIIVLAMNITMMAR